MPFLGFTNHKITPGVCWLCFNVGNIKHFCFWVFEVISSYSSNDAINSDEILMIYAFYIDTVSALMHSVIVVIVVIYLLYIMN